MSRGIDWNDLEVVPHLAHRVFTVTGILRDGRSKKARGERTLRPIETSSR